MLLNVSCRYALCDRMGDTRIISTTVGLCVAVDRKKSESFGFCQVDMYAMLHNIMEYMESDRLLARIHFLQGSETA